MSPANRPKPTACDLRTFRRHQHLVREGEAPEAIYRLEEGWACRYQLLSSGRRQITALFLPGEYCEPQWLLEPRSAHPIVALTTLRARSFPLAEVSANAPSAKDNMRTMLAATLGLLNRQTDWIATLGRKNALERVCALLSDVFERLRDNGRVSNNRCAMPLTQPDLADIVGLTPVHVNRVLKQLRSEGLVEIRGKQLRLPDPVTLFSIGAGNAAVRPGDRKPRTGDRVQPSGTP